MVPPVLRPASTSIRVDLLRGDGGEREGAGDALSNRCVRAPLHARACCWRHDCEHPSTAALNWVSIDRSMRVWSIALLSSD